MPDFEFEPGRLKDLPEERPFIHAGWIAVSPDTVDYIVNDPEDSEFDDLIGQWLEHIQYDTKDLGPIVRAQAQNIEFEIPAQELSYMHGFALVLTAIELQFEEANTPEPEFMRYVGRAFNVQMFMNRMATDNTKHARHVYIGSKQAGEQFAITARNQLTNNNPGLKILIDKYIKDYEPAMNELVLEAFWMGAGVAHHLLTDNVSAAQMIDALYTHPN